jgi:hypothetical protein
MKKKILVTVVLGFVMVFAFNVVAMAVKVSSDASVKEFISDIDNNIIPNADLETNLNLTVKFDDTNIVLPQGGNNILSIVKSETNNEDFAFDVTLPLQNIELSIENDVALYNDENSNFLQAIQVEDKDVNIVTSILNFDAPDEFVYNFNLPDGARMGYSNDATAIYIYDAKEKIIALIVPGVARDNNENDVDFSLSLQDNKIVQRLSENQNVAYPLNLSISLMTTYNFDHYFYSGSWINRSDGISLSLDPNGSNLYGLYTPPGYNSHKDASWASVYNKFYTSSHWKNTFGMQSQYKCHYDYWAFWQGDNPTWDLEPWRGNVEANWGNKCNP